MIQSNKLLSHLDSKVQQNILQLLELGRFVEAKHLYQSATPLTQK